MPSSIFNSGNLYSFRSYILKYPKLYAKSLLDVLVRLTSSTPEYLDLYFLQRRRKSRREAKRKSLNLKMTCGGNPGEGPILIIVPKWHFPDSEWLPGQGTFFFELYQSAVEYYGFNCVAKIIVQEHSTTWASDVLAILESGQFSRILLPVEGDPHDPESWTLDDFLVELRGRWQGTIIALLFDSVWKETILRVDKLVTIDKSIVVVAIDRRINRIFSKSTNVIGPILFPISNQTIDLRFPPPVIEEFDIKYEESSVGFVGKIYPYRRKVLEKFSMQGLPILINRHVKVLPEHSYEAYISSIQASLFSLNLSRANLRNIPQFKTRILEVALAGSVILTDENSLLSRYFVKNINYFFFRNSSDVIKIIGRKDSGRDLWKIVSETYAKARKIASSQFWSELEDSNRIPL